MINHRVPCDEPGMTGQLRTVIYGESLWASHRYIAQRRCQHPSCCTSDNLVSLETLWHCTTHHQQSGSMEYQAVQVNAFNSAAPTDGATIVTKTLTDPAANEVQVKLLLAGVNPSGAG